MKYVKKNQVQIIFILLLCLLFILFSNCSFFGMQKDDGKPSVVITFPGDGAEVSGTITIQTVARDDNGIYKVTFKVDGGVIGDCYSAPYEKSWNTANESSGIHTITAVAYDDAGNSKESEAVQVTVVKGGTGTAAFSEDFESYNYGEVGITGQLLSDAWLASGLENSVLTIADDPASSGRGKSMHIEDGSVSGDQTLMVATFSGVSEGAFSFDAYFSSNSTILFSLAKNVNDNLSYGFNLSCEEEVGTGDLLLIYTDEGTAYQSGTVISPNTWHEISGVFDCASGLYALYFDGDLVDTGLGFSDTIDLVDSYSVFTLPDAGYSADIYLDNIELTEEDVDPGSGTVEPPATPQNFSASDGEYDDRILLSWDAVAEANYYNIYRSDTLNGTYVMIGWVSSGTTSTSNSTSSPSGYEITPGTHYFYKVEAEIYDSASDTFIQSEQSDPDEGWAQASVLSPPTGVTATQGTYSDYISVSWNSNPEASTYKVYYATSAGGEYFFITNGETSNTYMDVTGATPEVSYFFKVSSVDSGGTESELSETPAEGWVGAAVLSPPTGVSSTDGSYTSIVRVSWSSVTDADRYYVSRSTSSGGPYSLLSGYSTGTSYDDSSGTPGTRYYYVVRSWNSTSGYSDYSSENSGYRKLSTPGIPSASDGGGDVYVSWSSVSGATGYYLYRSSDYDGTYLYAGYSSTNSYSDTSTTASTPYFYTVRAYSSSSSSYSDYSSANTNSAHWVASGAPTASAPSAVWDPFTLTLTYSWPLIGSTSEHYNIEYSYTTDSTWYDFGDTTWGYRTNPMYVTMYPGASDVGKTVQVRARAYTSAGWTAWSNIEEVYVYDY